MVREARSERYRTKRTQVIGSNDHAILELDSDDRRSCYDRLLCMLHRAVVCLHI